MKNFPPDVWGPHFWFFFHTISLFYPQFPNDIIKKRYYELIQNFHLFIPHDESSSFFQKLLDKYPLKPFLDSRDSFVQWTHFIHNKVNLHLNKPQFSFHDFYGLYYSKFQHNQSKFIIRKKYKTIILFIFFFLFISISLYFYLK